MAGDDRSAMGEAEARAALTAAMDRHADGDGSAFAQVYDRLAPRLGAYFLRHTRDRGRSEDLVQQTLLQMHLARQSFAKGSDVIPWAFAIARRLLIDAHRRKKELLLDSPDDDAEALEMNVARDSCPEGIVATKQIAACVREELERLPDGQRAAFELMRADGMSVAQAAEVLGATPTAVKLRAHRVYEALRNVIARASGGEDERAPAKQRAPRRGER
jgi:RNA polymerase sigma-70 factor (ECF subfamily)